MGLAYQIRTTLGWEEMDPTIALSAIDRIMCNYISLVSDIVGIPGELIEESLDQALTCKSSDYLWRQLFISEAYETCKDLTLEVGFRSAIESKMRTGMTFEEAINLFII